MALVNPRAHISFLHNKISEFVSHADYWDTSLTCSDGTMCQSKLIVGLVFPELENSSRFDSCVEPVIVIPDLTCLEVQTMIDSLFDQRNKPFADPSFDSSLKCLVKVEVETEAAEMNFSENLVSGTKCVTNPAVVVKHDTEMTEAGQTKPRTVRVRRTCEYKLAAVAEAKMSSNHGAARKLGLEESTIRHWRRNEEKLKEQLRQGGGKRFRLAGGGNKQHHKELEEELVQWVLAHQNVRKVTQSEICKQALVIYNRIYEGVDDKKDFNASKGWLYRFLSRNNLTGSDIISFHERKEYDDDEKDFSCEQCGKRFLYESSLKTHMSTHTGERPHVCSFCAKAFRLRKDMIIHERIHTGEKPYSCQVCGKSCYDSSNLRKHEKCHEFK